MLVILSSESILINNTITNCWATYGGMFYAKDSTVNFTDNQIINSLSY